MTLADLKSGREGLEERGQERTTSLEEAQKKLHHSATELIRAQENERKLIAQELHDSLISNLAAVKYSLERRFDHTTNGRGGRDMRFAELISIVDKSIEEVRRIIANLRPSILDDLGILPTIGWLAREFQKVYPHIRLQAEISAREQDIPEDLKIVIFRVLQEALNNVAKHSKASLVRISLDARQEAIRMRIRDNGKGFVMAHTFPRKMGSGLGLSSMRERIEVSGGKFLVESSCGKGTVIQADWRAG